MPHLIKNICVHFDVPETFASHIVKCPIQHGFYTDGLFMVYNIIAHLRGLADPYQLYNGDVDSLQVFRDWLAAAMLRDDIPKDFQFN